MKTRDGRAELPRYETLERLVMRALFALVVWLHIPRSLAHIEITAPHGVGRLLDLRFLLDPQVFAIAQYAMWIALLLYVARVGWSIVLPYLTVLSVLVGTLSNSRGGIGHNLQIVSLVLCAQTAAHFWSVFRQRAAAGASDSRAAEDRVIWWSQQAIVATYFVSGLTKLIRSSGMWIFESPLIAAQIVKSNEQFYYNRLEAPPDQFGATIAEWMAHHPFVVGAVLSIGLLLELTAPLALVGRRAALGYGVGLLLFHVTVHRVMKLDFAFNSYLLWIYLVNVPFWVLLVVRAIQRRGRAA